MQSRDEDNIDTQFLISDLKSEIISLQLELNMKANEVLQMTTKHQNAISDLVSQQNLSIQEMLAKQSEVDSLKKLLEGKGGILKGQTNDSNTGSSNGTSATVNEKYKKVLEVVHKEFEDYRRASEIERDALRREINELKEKKDMNFTSIVNSSVELSQASSTPSRPYEVVDTATSPSNKVESKNNTTPSKTPENQSSCCVVS
jgi:hypothetical protein